jgi:hypothetical protein
MTGVESPSVNEKTGPMVQVSIIRQEGVPLDDFGSPRETAICGTCPLKGKGRDRICYVHWAAWLLGKHVATYPVITLSEAAEAVAYKPVRLGTYGDPAAVPYHVWLDFLAKVNNHTGYTHAWRDCDIRMQHYCMASIETKDDAIQAHALGWRTFRVKLPGFDVHADEIVCPNETSGVQCVKCRLCYGARGVRREFLPPSIVIDAHGSGAGRLVRLVQRRLFP